MGDKQLFSISVIPTKHAKIPTKPFKIPTKLSFELFRNQKAPRQILGARILSHFT